MSVALVQSTYGSVTYNTGFNSTTTAGNLLVCAVTAIQDGASSSDGPPTINTPVTSGVTWTLGKVVSATYAKEGAHYYTETVAIYYAVNAASIVPSTHTTCSVTGNGVGGVSGGLQLAEYSGFGTTVDLVTASGTNPSQSPPASAGTLVTGGAGVINVLITNPNYNTQYVAGSGYTKIPGGVGPGASSWGVQQYEVMASGGSYATTWGPAVGQNGPWACAAVAFVIPDQPVLSVTPTSLSFSGVQGGSNPASQSVAIANTGTGTMNWTMASDQSWLTAAPTSGTDAGTVAVSVNLSGLTAGSYTGHLTITATGATGSPATVTVSLTVGAATAVLALSTHVLEFVAPPNGSNPADQTVLVSNSGTPGTMNFTVTSDSTWLTTAPTSGDAGTTPVSLTVSVNITGLARGVHNGVLTVASGAASNSPQIVAVTLFIVDIFRYIKSFPLTSGAQRTVALDKSGAVWEEDVVNDPFVLHPLLPTAIPGSYGFSTTKDDVEYFCFSDLKHGTDIPRQYNPQPASGAYTLDRISQVGPGAPPTFQATVGGSGSQATITSWAGVGSVVTFQAVNSFMAGEVVTLSDFAVSTFFNGVSVQVLGTGLSGTQFEVEFAGYSGGTDTGLATPQFGFGIASITQPAQKSDPDVPGHFRALWWSAGVGNQSAGSVITVYYTDLKYPEDPQIVAARNQGLPCFVYISSAPFGNGTQLITSSGKFLSDNGRWYWFFTFDAQGGQSNRQILNNDSATGYYQVSIATVTTQTPVPDFSVGDQFAITGVGTSGWNSSWSMLVALNSGVYAITQTEMDTGTATYTWSWAGVGSPITPLVGQLVTIIQTLNGNGVFNVVDALIATVTGGPASGTFTITGFNSPNVPAAAENGQAQTAGTKFQFDPGQKVVGTTQSPIYGNVGAGGVLSLVGGQTAIGAGTRQAVVFFETRNGYKTAVSAPITFTTDVAATSITANNIPVGPPNVIRRWIAFTGAGPNGIPGPYFYTIDAPVTYTLNGQTYRYTPTYIDDNISTSATFVFTDAVLLSGEEIDVQGNDLFSEIELGSSAWNVAYADRMFYGLEENKVLNFVNLSFDGGYLPNPNAAVYPLGWGVDPTSNPATTPVTFSITAYRFLPTFPGGPTELILTAINNLSVGALVQFSSMGSPLAGLDNQIYSVIVATSTTFTIYPTISGSGFGSTTGTATLISPNYGSKLQTSPVFGNSLLIFNYSNATVATVGMLTQTAYQDAYNIPIILPNTLYSVRVIARIPAGLTTGNLIVDLTQSNQGLISGTGTVGGYGITYGTYTLPLASVSGTMAIYSGTLLTTPFTTGVPSGLVLRVWGQNLGAGVDVEVDRIEVFPTATPTLSTNIRVSYVNNFEAFDANTGNLGLAAHNQQPVYGAVELHDQLYFLQSASMQVTQDIPGVEPSSPGGGWAVHEVSNRVGACGIYAYDYGEEWILTACRNGIFGFNGGQPIRIDFQQKELWDLINWSAGTSIVLRNDLAERRIVCAVPLPTPNPWLPYAPTNASPTMPNVILMWNWQGLDDFQELVSGRAMHTTMFGTLVSTDMRIKMSIWQIPTEYIGLITQPDLTTQALTICGSTPGVINQMSASQTTDNGAQIPSTYSTFGFVNAEKARENPLLGLHRKRFSLLQMLLSGSGAAKIQVFPNYILNPKTLVLNPNAWTVPGGITLQQQPPDDQMRPLNVSGQRAFVVVSSNASSTSFNLSKLIMVGVVEQLLTLNPNSG